MPTVSVIVPTYDRNDRLAAALRSVEEQTREPQEVIVVDGSDDGRAERVTEQYGATHVLQDEALPGISGAAAARDLGVDRASGTYVKFLDDDDRLRPDAIERQVDLAASDPDVGVVYSGLTREGGHDVYPDPAVRGNVLEHALGLQVAPCIPSTMLVERSLLEEVGPMREMPHDDAALIIELALRTEFEFVEDTLVTMGAIEGSLGGSESSMEGRRATIATYTDLYEQYPSARRTALARTTFQRGSLRLADSGWSAGAIADFARAAYYARGRPMYLGALLASVLGRPGWSIGVEIYHALTDGELQGPPGRVG